MMYFYTTRFDYYSVWTRFRHLPEYINLFNVRCVVGQNPLTSKGVNPTTSCCIFLWKHRLKCLLPYSIFNVDKICILLKCEKSHKIKVCGSMQITKKTLTGWIFPVHQGLILCLDKLFYWLGDLPLNRIDHFTYSHRDDLDLSTL